METIKLRDDYIKLGQALKAAGFVESGVDAKFAIQDGLVKVNGTVETQHVFTAGDKLLPPKVLDVTLEFHAIRTVVPSIGEAVINFGTRENESAAFTEGNDVLKSILDFLCHDIILLEPFFRRD